MDGRSVSTSVRNRAHACQEFPASCDPLITQFGTEAEVKLNLEFTRNGVRGSGAAGNVRNLKAGRRKKALPWSQTVLANSASAGAASWMGFAARCG